MLGPILLVAGARPNFMKIAPLHQEFSERGSNVILLHSGQHYDDNMSQVFFDDLGIPEPDLHLGVGSGSHAKQTAEIMISFEKVCLELNPSMVIVVGDVNSTIACAMVAAKLLIPCAHVEAGLRSGDMDMPEEVNRVLTDRICNLLLTPSPDGDENLRAEGVEEERIFPVGNIMIDSLLSNLEKSRRSGVLERLNLKEGEFGVITLHRPSNVDNPETLSGLIKTINKVCQSIAMVLPLHPRTRNNLVKFDLIDIIQSIDNLTLTEPLGYHEFQGLISASALVLTDSGGIQEETTAMGIPCLTMRENTERPITIEQGTNQLVGIDQGLILEKVHDVLETGGKRGRIPEMWDGRTAERIVDIVLEWLQSKHDI